MSNTDISYQLEGPIRYMNAQVIFVTANAPEEETVLSPVIL